MDDLNLGFNSTMNMTGVPTNASADCNELSGDSCNESTSMSVSDSFDYSDAVQLAQVVNILVPVMFGAVVVVGLVGNSLVVIVVLFNKQMRSTTNLLIINLAIADLLFIIFCVPFTATDYSLLSWPFGDAWCRIVQYLILVCAYMSVYTLVLMSVDRFLAVVHPISSMSIRTEHNTIVVITITWMTIILFCIPAMITHGNYKYIFMHREKSQCMFLSNTYNYPAFQISFFLSGYIVPLTLISLLYIIMLISLWKSAGVGGQISAESLRAKKRVTRMVVFVVLVFAISWLPIHLILLLKSLDKYILSQASIYAQIVSQILAYTNSCVNPILYAFLSENFRKSFHKVISCGSKKGGSRMRRLKYEATDGRAEKSNTNTNVLNMSKLPTTHVDINCKNESISAKTEKSACNASYVV